MEGALKGLGFRGIGFSGLQGVGFRGLRFRPPARHPGAHPAPMASGSLVGKPFGLEV